MITQEEYGEAYQREFRRTVRLVQSRGASADHAEEVAQQAWFQGWRLLGQLRERRALMGWINAIALNWHRRSGALESRYQPLMDGAHPQALSAASVDVARILAICSPQQRALFQRQLSGLTTREIAKEQGVTATAIRVRFLRAHRKVRTGLEAKGEALRESYREGIHAAA